MEKTKNQLKSKSKKIFDKFGFYYDQIYSDKDYQKEIEFIVSMLKKYENRRSKKILDLGCGTGGHSLLLAKKSYSVTGIDSSDIVLKIARKKFSENGIRGRFLKGDMKEFDLCEKFDSCISLFCSLCYLPTSREFKMALHNIAKHLKPKGLLIFDFWNGNAVINQKPSKKIKIIKKGKRKINRIAQPRINYLKQICDIEYHCKVWEKNLLIDDFKETHRIRYHFPADLESYLNETGFELVKIIPINRKTNDNAYLNEWYLYAIAKKR